MNESTSQQDRFEAALRRFDQENSADPIRQKVGHNDLPRELAYAQWVSAWVIRLEPNASEPLRLAARSVHLCRWTIPRDSYPMTRAGYLRWRQELKSFHGRKVGEILTQTGYPADLVERVQGLVSKKAFPSDPESRILEDALCLVFLEHQFAELAAKSTDEKMVNALQKTWAKMTPSAQAIAQGLPLGARERGLLERALIP